MQPRVRSIGFLLGLGLVLNLVAACTTNPASGERELVLRTSSAEVRQGRQMHEDLVESGMLYENEQLTAYVDAVGQRVAEAADRSELDYHFHVVDDPSVNAFAFPGGYVYVARGLLPYLDNEAQLAAVLAHEVGHVAARHSSRLQAAGRGAQILSTTAAIFTGSGALYEVGQAYGASITSGYGREMELEADALGAEYLARAGYNSNAMLQVLQVLKDQEVFAAEVEGRSESYHGLYASHPRNDRRLHEVIQLGAESSNDEAPDYVEPVGDFLSHVEGMPWGEAAADGVVRNGRYYHGRLGIVIDFPEGWRVQDGTTTLTATPPDRRDSGMTVRLQALAQEGIEPQAFLREELGLALTAGEAIEADGMPGYLGTVEREEDDTRLRLAAVILKDGRAYIFRGDNHERSRDDDFIEAFSDTVGSFRAMRSEDRSAATTASVELIEAEPGDTFESLARRYELGRNGADRLRLLNGHFPRGEPRAGDPVKIIRERR